MYAVIATGGKQYKVTQGETLRVEKLEGEEGSTVKLDNVLMVADGDKVEVGSPTLDKASVTAKSRRMAVATRLKSSSFAVASTRAGRWVTVKAILKSK